MSSRAQDLCRLESLLSGFERAPAVGSEKAIKAFGAITIAFRQAGLSADQQRQFVFRSACCVTIAIMTGCLWGLLPASALGCAVLLCVKRCLVSRITKRVSEFETQYTAFLVSFASSVRAGREPVAAICGCAAVFELDSVMHTELQRFETELEAGRTEDEAIREFASSVPHPDLPLFRTVVILARRQGTSLGESLHRLTRVTRMRQSFRRKMRAALAMQRLSAIGISVCAMFIGLFQAATNPAGMMAAWAHGSGKFALIGSVALMATGLIWMLRLARQRQ